MRIFMSLAVVTLLASGCRSTPGACEDALKLAKEGFVAGALIGLPADVACLPLTIPLAMALGLTGGCHGVPDGPGVYALVLPSFVAGGAVAVAVGAPALAVAIPCEIASALAAPRSERPPRGPPPPGPEDAAAERETRAIQVMVERLADPSARDMMVRQLAGRRAAVPLLIRALDDPARAAAAARALAAHRELPIVREALGHFEKKKR